MSKKLIGIEGVDFIICKLCGKRFEQITTTHLKKHNISILEYKKLYSNINLQCDNVIKRKIESKNKINHKIEYQDYIVCQICGKKFKNLSGHLTRSHKMSKEEYLKLYPDSLLISNKLKSTISKNTLEQWKNDNYKNFMINHWQTYWLDEENRLNQHERVIKYNRLHPEKSKKHSEDMKEMWLDENKREHQRIMLTEIWNNKDRRDKASKDGIERLSKLTKEEIMELTLGMRSHWTLDRKEKHNQWQRDRWTDKMRADKSKIRIQYYIDHPEASEEASKKSIEYYKNNLETFIERGKLISAGHQGISREEWDHFIWEENDWRDWINTVYLNEWFNGCHRHHITKTLVIHIPGELHNHISHNLKTGRGMGKMNMLALQFMNGEL
jgi:predicted transcriptional regulator